MKFVGKHTKESSSYILKSLQDIHLDYESYPHQINFFNSQKVRMQLVFEAEWETKKKKSSLKL